MSKFLLHLDQLLSSKGCISQRIHESAQTSQASVPASCSARICTCVLCLTLFTSKCLVTFVFSG